MRSMRPSSDSETSTSMSSERFRTTATGKVKRGHSHARHILTKKTAKRKRTLDIDVLVSESDEVRIKRMLPYGRS